MLASHLAVLLTGFALGIYLLPILTAPMTPSEALVQSTAGKSDFRGQFRRDLAGSDLLHWGEGEISVGKQTIASMGKVSPGPDYKLYLVPEFVENEAQFLKVKARSARLGDIKTSKISSCRCATAWMWRGTPWYLSGARRFRNSSRQQNTAKRSPLPEVWAQIMRFSG